MQAQTTESLIQLDTATADFSVDTSVHVYSRKQRNRKRRQRGWPSPPRPFQCSRCNKWCLTAGNLAHHARLHVKDVNMFACRGCGTTFRSIGGLNRHVKVNVNAGRLPQLACCKHINFSRPVVRKTDRSEGIVYRLSRLQLVHYKGVLLSAYIDIFTLYIHKLRGSGELIFLFNA